MVLNVCPEFSKALQMTQLLGTKRGRGAFMMKQSYKRRKTNNQAAQEIAVESEKDEEISELKSQIARLKIHKSDSAVRNFGLRSPKKNNSAKSKMSF